MKVTFEFDTLDENFIPSELERMKNVDKMASVLYDITNQLRSWDKYDERNSIPKDEICDKIWDIITDAGLNIDELL